MAGRRWHDELDRQVGTIGERFGPVLDDATVADLHARLDEAVDAETLPETDGGAPLTIVVTRDVVPFDRSVPALRLPNSSREGVIDRNYAGIDLAEFAPIEPVAADMPDSPVYLLFDVDRGEEFRNVPPQEALPTILGRGRTPLTMDEGVAVATHHALLAPNRCFMLSGSRRADRRVPALWISGKAPKLGWCWDGNPHSWLGVASAGGRR